MFGYSETKLYIYGLKLRTIENIQQYQLTKSIYFTNKFVGVVYV